MLFILMNIINILTIIYLKQWGHFYQGLRIYNDVQHTASANQNIVQPTWSDRI